MILESTSPVGSTEQMAEWLAAERPDLRFPQQGDEPDVFIAYCPERVLPGQIMVELIKNDRVIGGMTPACSARASALYRLFSGRVRGNSCPYRRNVQADRKQLPGRKHCVCQ